MTNFNQIFSKIFPPAALIPVDGMTHDASEKFRNEVASSIKSINTDDIENVYEWAKFIHESEVSRKETIESKAQSYLMGLSVSIGIMAAIPFLFSDRWSLPNWAENTVATLFTIAIIFMNLAGFYALKTRQVGAMFLPSADLFKKQLEGNNIGFSEKSTQLIWYAKNNEKPLIEKSNYLYVSEMCFVRAIWVISFAIVIAVGSKICQSFSEDIETHSVTKSDVCESVRKEAEAIKGSIELTTSNLEYKSKEIYELIKKSERIEEKISQIKMRIIECRQ